MSQATPLEDTLDPADWESFRQLAHRMVDDTIDHLRTLRDRPAWQPMPAEVVESFRAPLPTEGIGEEAAYAEYVRNVLPYPSGNLHPRFSGWVQGTGTPLGMMAEMLAAALNPHMAGFNQAPALVEHQVLAWLGELLGLPGASGVLVSGGTMANTLGLAVARHAGADFDLREQGLQGDRPRMVFYGSSETHGWARKAAEFLGLGSEAFRQVPAGADHRIRVGELRARIAEDRGAGLAPFCVIGTAGTVNTGAIDPLDELADLCAEEGLWFHVDGAFGAMAYLSAELRPLLRGMERADSLGFDLHKWGYLPFECACALIRDPETHRAAFASSAAYLAATERGVIAGGLPFAERGLELTRNFKALKVWMSLKAYGSARLARLIEQNVAQARYLARRVQADPRLELLAEVPLNVVCFRYAPAGVPAGDLNALNEEILMRLQEDGIAVPSGTTLDGRFALRAAIVNHRSRREDFDALVDGVLKLGAGLAGPGAASASAAPPA